MSLSAEFLTLTAVGDALPFAQRATNVQVGLGDVLDSFGAWRLAASSDCCAASVEIRDDPFQCCRSTKCGSSGACLSEHRPIVGASCGARILRRTWNPVNRGV